MRNRARSRLGEDRNGKAQRDAHGSRPRWGRDWIEQDTIGRFPTLWRLSQHQTYNLGGSHRDGPQRRAGEQVVGTDELIGPVLLVPSKGPYLKRCLGVALVYHREGCGQLSWRQL